MRTYRLSKLIEALGYCHDCHNRAQVEVMFSKRVPIRLCDRCARFLIADLVRLVRPAKGNRDEDA